MNELDRLFESSLDGANAIGFRLGRLTEELHPGKYVLDGVGSPFDLETFAGEAQCEAELVPSAHAELETAWRRKHGLQSHALNGAYDVRWNGKAFRVICASWRVGYGDRSISVVVGLTTISFCTVRTLSMPRTMRSISERTSAEGVSPVSNTTRLKLVTFR